MKLRYVVNQLYNYFDNKFYNLDANIVKHIDKDLITTFLIELHKDYTLQSISNDFLFKYLTYQYDYWKDRDVKGFGNHTRPLNVFGPKAYSRFKKNNINSKYSWYNAEKSLSERYGINRKILLDYESNFKKDSTKLHLDEEQEKLVFNQSDVQLLHCIDNTTLFNDRSSVCSKCNASVKCKKILKEIYRQTYIDRGYEASISEKSKEKSRV